MKYFSMFAMLTAVVCVSVFPEQAWAVSQIDSQLDDFKTWLMDNVVETIAVIALVLWALNAFFGWWRGGTDWRAGIGLVVLNIIVFSADKVVTFFQ